MLLASRGDACERLYAYTMRTLPADIRTRGAVHTLREWTISSQGIGYNDAYQIKDDEDWALNLGKLDL